MRNMRTIHLSQDHKSVDIIVNGDLEDEATPLGEQSSPPVPKSRYGYVYLIKHKSDTFKVFKRYQNEVENQLGRKIKLTPPRTPQLKRVTERRNRTLLDMVRSMMSRATLPISFWGYALDTAAYILNLVPTKKVSKTPFDMWKGNVLLLGTSKSRVIRLLGILYNRLNSVSIEVSSASVIVSTGRMFIIVSTDSIK
ncbi:retrotransposon protein, putative, ty1-copia subclass [Tanacetum coccineum]